MHKTNVNAKCRRQTSKKLQVKGGTYSLSLWCLQIIWAKLTWRAIAVVQPL